MKKKPSEADYPDHFAVAARKVADKLLAAGHDARAELIIVRAAVGTAVPHYRSGGWSILTDDFQMCACDQCLIRRREAALTAKILPQDAQDDLKAALGAVEAGADSLSPGGKATMECQIGMIAFRHLPDGRILSVLPLTFGRGRLCVGRDFDTWDRGY